MNLAQKILVGAIRFYQLALSPWLGRQCRYLPTCSEYGKEAIEKHGALRGSWLAAKRIGRCRPGCAHGYDPVPPVDPPKQ
ncbi:MAG: membrane protein insertion efficiency factor YidD [Hyphomicrobiaceae bacterium]